MQTRIISISFVVAGIFLATPAFGHLPITIGGENTTMETAFLVTDVDLSQVAYHRRTASQPELWLTFEAAANTPLFLQMGIPKIARLENYRPNLALIGPGLPQAEVPFDLPNGYGAQVFPADQDDPQEFYEPFTGTTSWQFSPRDLQLVEAGTYYVVGYAPNDEDGKFWVAVGKREEFSFADILSLPAIVVKVRLFHEVFPIGGIAMWAFLILLALLGLLLSKVLFWI